MSIIERVLLIYPQGMNFPLFLFARYSVEYTAVTAGEYYPIVKINGEEISTDMSSGVTIVPAEPSAVYSSFRTDLVRLCYAIRNQGKN